MLPSVNAHPTERLSDRRLSKLMKAMQGGNVPNACPFGCAAHQLSDQGFCVHLVGFTNGGRDYEPLIVNAMGRLQCDGSRREPLKPGDRLVRITVSARVYREQGNPQLTGQFTRERDENPAAAKEEQLRRMIADINNPILEGVVAGGTVNSVRPAFVGEDVGADGYAVPGYDDDEGDELVETDEQTIGDEPTKPKRTRK